MPETQRATFVAPSNIAFIKYWGIRDEDKVLPCNPSISMTLSRCTSKCTVEYDSTRSGDEVRFRQVGGTFEPAPDGFARPVQRHLENLRRRAGKSGGCKVWTENSFPTGAGIASSASGFSALTLAATEALGTPPEDATEASVLARMSGSGSAARSVMGGYVQWPADVGDLDEPAAMRIATAEHWDLRDVVAVVDSAPKGVSSRDGHRRAPSSPRFAPRLGELGERLEAVRDAIKRRDLETLGPIVESEAIDLHHVAMSSRPPIYYWKPGTLAVLWSIRSLRRDGVPVYATIDAGPNVHAICPAEFEEQVAKEFESMAEVESVLRDRVGEGPYSTSEHLGGS
ncbi:MAG: diphosphomevalonate decarboxylase [bacterium]|nr:diphosphomevalonate decarboxylase [bacterium]